MTTHVPFEPSDRQTLGRRGACHAHEVAASNVAGKERRSDLERTRVADQLRTCTLVDSALAPSSHHGLNHKCPNLHHRHWMVI